MNGMDRRTILIADDDASIRSLVGLLLEDDGYIVLSARDGEAALERSRTYAGRIHLLLSDVEMPGTYDGYGLASRLLGERRDIRILLMSGTKLPQYSFACLAKPFTPVELSRAILAVLAAPDTELEAGTTVGFTE